MDPTPTSQQPASPLTQPPQIPASPLPPPVQTVPIIPIICILITLISLSVAGYLYFQTQLLKQQLTILPIPSPTENAAMAPLSSPTPNQKVWKTFSDNAYNFQIDYPNDWTAEKQTVPKGQSIKVQGRYDINATDTSLDIISITNSTWELQIQLRDGQTDLGGQGPIPSLADFKVIPIESLARNVLRSKVEDGVLPFIGGDAGDKPTYPLPVFFQRKQGETSKSWRQPDTVGSYVTLFDSNDLSEKNNLSLTIYSNLLTKSNIENKKIAAEDLLTIDQVLATMRFTSKTTAIITSPTPTTSIPSGWVKQAFNKQTLVAYVPSSWQSDSQEHPTSTLLRFWRKSNPAVWPIQIDVKSNWDDTGTAKDMAKNYTVGGNIPAYRNDPPSKAEKTQSNYETVVYFENAGKVYVFQCNHDWDQDTLNTCNSMLQTISFTK